jgi:hypothetical protein
LIIDIRDGPLTDDFDIDELRDVGTLEPSANQRRFAHILYGTFVALTQVGFTVDQAITIVVGMTNSVGDELAE